MCFISYIYFTILWEFTQYILHDLKKSKARLKTQLSAYVNMVFPELLTFFKSGIHIAACYELLKMCPSPAEIAALRIDKLSNLLSKASHGRFGRSSAEALKSLAKTSVGVKNPYNIY